MHVYIYIIILWKYVCLWMYHNLSCSSPHSCFWNPTSSPSALNQSILCRCLPILKTSHTYGGFLPKRGTLTSSIFLGFCIINHPAIGVPPLMETSISTALTFPARASKARGTNATPLERSTSVGPCWSQSSASLSTFCGWWGLGSVPNFFGGD